MEDNQRFIPTFAGAPRFRLPFRSVFMPVVPCVLDGCLSLLELIAKLEYIINQYHDAIEANHTDIMNLYDYVEGALDDLREYIDTQDAAMLASAKAYTDSAITTLTAYVDAQDAAMLAAAKAYTDTEIAALKTYTDAQLALKQDLLTFDQVPMDGSTNPVESNGIYDALHDKQPKNIYINLTYDNNTQSWTGDLDFTSITGFLAQDRLIIAKADTDSITTGYARGGVQHFYYTGTIPDVQTGDEYKFSGETEYFTVTRLGGWVYHLRS